MLVPSCDLKNFEGKANEFVQYDEWIHSGIWSKESARGKKETHPCTQWFKGQTEIKAIKKFWVKKLHPDQFTWSLDFQELKRIYINL